MPNIQVIIPAFNEAQSIAKVVQAIPSMVSEVIVINNNSSDETASESKRAGATVLTENRPGYGFACLKGMEYIAQKNEPPDIVVFLDGDFSDYPEDLPQIVAPIISGEADFVIGARVKITREKGSMTPQQIFGNNLATFLMKLIFASRFTDLGPFRAIRYEKLLALNMSDKTYGWTVEMQLKVLKQRIRYVEVPVRYRKRIGVSKVSGTLKGTVLAGYKIIGWIIKYSFK